MGMGWTILTGEAGQGGDGAPTTQPVWLGCVWPVSLGLGCGCKEACVADVAKAWLGPHPHPRADGSSRSTGRTKTCKVAKRKSFPCSARWPWSLTGSSWSVLGQSGQWALVPRGGAWEKLWSEAGAASTERPSDAPLDQPR